MKRTASAFLICVLGACGTDFQSVLPHAVAAPEDKVITNSIGMKLALIPAGKFLMGSPADEAERDENEVQHEVTISKPFYMGVHEVTQREFTGLMAATVKRRAIFHEGRGGGPEYPME